MTRNQLATMLEGEGLLASADDVRGGGDIAAICSQAVQIGPRYDDGASREAMATCRDIAAGKLTLDD